MWKIGDRVIRKVGRTVVGTIKRVSSDKKRVQVNWHKARATFHSGDKDYHTWLLVDTLLPATAENVAARKQQIKELTPKMKRAIAIWQKEVGAGWARPADVYGGNETYWSEWERTVFRLQCRKILVQEYLPRDYGDGEMLDAGTGRYRLAERSQ